MAIVTYRIVSNVDAQPNSAGVGNAGHLKPSDNLHDDRYKTW
jgi:hypothetical protein